MTALETRVLEEEREYTAAGAAKLLHRSKAWVSAHAEELGGFRDGPRGNWRIPLHGIHAYQLRRSKVPE